MGHARMHGIRRKCFLHLFLSEQAKLFTNSLDYCECIMVVTNIQVRHSLARTDIFLKQKSLSFWHCDNPITPGAIVIDIPILLRFRDG